MLRLLFGLGAMLLIAVQGGCSDSPQHFHGVRDLRLTGRFVQERASSEQLREVDAQVLLIVRSEGAPHPNPHSPGSPIGDSHCPALTQHRADVRLAPAADGTFDHLLRVANFTPVSHPDCPLSLLSHQRLQTIRVHALGELGSENPTLLRGVARAAEEQIQATGDGAAHADLEVRFSRPVVPLQPGEHPDLIFDAEAMESSWIVRQVNVSEGSCALNEGCFSGTGLRRIVNYDTVIVNAGTAPLHIGAPSPHVGAEYDDCHEHYHVGGVVQVDLLTPGGDVVVSAVKQGFCLMDTARVSATAGAQFTCSYQGITPGWADVYDQSIDCQWVDVTDVPPGEYRLRFRVNPDLEHQESDYSNNEIEFPVTL